MKGLTNKHMKNSFKHQRTKLHESVKSIEVTPLNYVALDLLKWEDSTDLFVLCISDQLESTYLYFEAQSLCPHATLILLSAGTSLLFRKHFIVLQNRVSSHNDTKTD